MLWVLDLDGVVWLAGTPIPGSASAIERLHAAGHRVAFVTNNSTPRVAEHVERLAHAGVQAGADELVTSAQAAASILEPGARAACIAGGGVREALEQRGVSVVAPIELPEAVVVGRTLSLDFQELSDAASAIRSGARFIATNTDATFPTPHGLEPGAGALVAFLEVASGQKPETAGKPGKPMSELLKARFGEVGIVVGDRPDTDGLFARRLGAKFALVLSGVTRESDLPVDPAPDLLGGDLQTVVALQLDG
ncbi:MAG TPA: HAD-IIA family hydrolase [Acidimicrobiales bacterium]|nr:HAD-IIA family hydrolase [Acidimicrobiales bacterium]